MNHERRSMPSRGRAHTGVLEMCAVWRGLTFGLLSTRRVYGRMGRSSPPRHLAVSRSLARDPGSDADGNTRQIHTAASTSRRKCIPRQSCITAWRQLQYSFSTRSCAELCAVWRGRIIRLVFNAVRCGTAGHLAIEAIIPKTATAL